MGQNLVRSLQDYFSGLNDPRAKSAKRHELLDIIIIAVCAIICEADSWVDVAEFGRSKLEWFQSFLHLPNGIPSHDTFGKVFALLNPKEFAHCFRLWAEGLKEALSGQIISIDGKTLRGSHDYASGKTSLNLVSAWATENHLVLRQLRVADSINKADDRCVVVKRKCHPPHHLVANCLTPGVVFSWTIDLPWLGPSTCC